MVSVGGLQEKSQTKRSHEAHGQSAAASKGGGAIVVGVGDDGRGRSRRRPGASRTGGGSGGGCAGSGDRGRTLTGNYRLGLGQGECLGNSAARAVRVRNDGGRNGTIRNSSCIHDLERAGRSVDLVGIVGVHKVDDIAAVRSQSNVRDGDAELRDGYVLRNREIAVEDGIFAVGDGHGDGTGVTSVVRPGDCVGGAEYPVSSRRRRSDGDSRDGSGDSDESSEDSDDGLC